jgi:hypothetical protein
MIYRPDYLLAACIAEVLLMLERFSQRFDLISQGLCEAVDLLFPLSLRLQCFADARLFCFTDLKYSLARSMKCFPKSYSRRFDDQEISAWTTRACTKCRLCNQGQMLL